jgi:hypothetical protein
MEEIGTYGRKTSSMEEIGTNGGKAPFYGKNKYQPILSWHALYFLGLF